MMNRYTIFLWLLLVSCASCNSNTNSKTNLTPGPNDTIKLVEEYDLGATALVKSGTGRDTGVIHEIKDNGRIYTVFTFYNKNGVASVKLDEREDTPEKGN